MLSVLKFTYLTFKVLDTTTGARLPYVACYACKVLYTDTGGGTGNMTRHRCPLGTSYKDSSIGWVVYARISRQTSENVEFLIALFRNVVIHLCSQSPLFNVQSDGNDCCEMCCIVYWRTSVGTFAVDFFNE